MNFCLAKMSSRFPLCRRSLLVWISHKIKMSKSQVKTTYALFKKKCLDLLKCSACPVIFLPRCVAKQFAEIFSSKNRPGNEIFMTWRDIHTFSVSKALLCAADISTCKIYSLWLKWSWNYDVDLGVAGGSVDWGAHHKSATSWLADRDLCSLFTLHLKV